MCHESHLFVCKKSYSLVVLTKENLPDSFFLKTGSAHQLQLKAQEQCKLQLNSHFDECSPGDKCMHIFWHLSLVSVYSALAVLMLLPYILVNHEECFECSPKFICTLVLRNVHQVNCEELSNFKVFTRAHLDSSFEEHAPSVTMNCGGNVQSV